MRSCAALFVLAFFESLAAVTLMTALGLIATMIYASTASGCVLVLICVTIGLLAVGVIYFQVAHVLERLRDEERAYAHNEPVFATLTHEEKTALEALLFSRSMAANETLQRIEGKSGFVWRDPTTARFFVHPLQAKIVPRLVKQWRKRSP